MRQNKGICLYLLNLFIVLVTSAEVFAITLITIGIFEKVFIDEFYAGMGFLLMFMMLLILSLFLLIVVIRYNCDHSKYRQIWRDAYIN